MEWKEFKKRVEEAGVKDDDDIFFIDVHLPYKIEAHKDDLGWVITE